ncbi:Aliphatic amidase regulator [Grimontia celer]|uniref:Aliphatic amidase regulator n=1 Tax=Grimontia celer TaxID=1796497 RepID=A0A128EUW5_9GAMM|nr:ANTAR domain-containing protein [Grimontia celer]CZF78363.1 Aliphatic amidase regulator [Grimontia celer]
MLIHPHDGEKDGFLAHLKRIGCQVESAWPPPQTLPDHIDVVLFLVQKSYDKEACSWMSSESTIAKIAIIDFETPEILNALERQNIHGVLSKPIRLFGVLAVLTTAIGVASHEARLRQRIESLDETLKARRKVERAVAILAESRNISEEEAYKRIRRKAQDSRQSIAQLADAIIDSDGL